MKPKIRKTGRQYAAAMHAETRKSNCEFVASLDQLPDGTLIVQRVGDGRPTSLGIFPVGAPSEGDASRCDLSSEAVRAIGAFLSAGVS